MSINFVEETRIEGPWVLGTAPNPGSRTDIAAVKQCVDDFKPMSYIWDNFFKTMVKYHKAVERYSTQKVKARDFKSELYWIWGESGAGKSTAAKKLAKHLGGTVFYKTVFHEQWWDGYRGEDIVVFDDFRASFLRYGALMQMIGNDYPIKVPIKGDFVNFRAKFIIFTSIDHPESVYKLGMYERGLKRRCVGRTFYQYRYKPYKTDETSLTIHELDELIPESW